MYVVQYVIIVLLQRGLVRRLLCGLFVLFGPRHRLSSARVTDDPPVLPSCKALGTDYAIRVIKLVTGAPPPKPVGLRPRQTHHRRLVRNALALLYIILVVYNQALTLMNCQKHVVVTE